MTATPVQRAIADNPTTPPEVLHQLAAIEPELWPAIAAHPNAYPDLVTWIRENTPPVEAVVAPIAEVVAPVGMAGLGTRTTPSGPGIRIASTRSRRPRGKVLIGLIAGAGTLAVAVVVILVVTLSVVPQRQAEEKAAAAHSAAVGQFTSVAALCETANSTYKSALDHAIVVDTTDPATMNDANLIVALHDQLATTGDVELCVVPEMAKADDEILEQVSVLSDQFIAVDRATTALTDASSAVEHSVATKAAATTAAADAALLASRTWTLKDSQGYSFTASLSASAPTTSFTSGDQTLGDACSFDKSSDIAVPVTMLVTATTEGFDTNVGARVYLTQSGRSATPHEVQIESYLTDGANCDVSQNSGGNNVFAGVQWSDPFTTGRRGEYKFVVIIRDWRTPATPNGDTAFLDALSLTVLGTQGSSFSAVSGKTVLLSSLD